jgi:4-carboxymuconolactone decarboxylase
MGVSHSGERLPAIPVDQQNQAQKKAVAALISGSRRDVRGPFIPMLRSPEMLDRAQRLGEYLRFRSVVPRKLRELAILATARHWQQTYEWHAHVSNGLEAGLSEQSIDTLASATVALDWDHSDLPADEATVLRFVRELHRQHATSDAVYAQTKALLGEDGVVELCGICGYYAMLAMVMNVARTPVPEGASVPFGPPQIAER